VEVEIRLPPKLRGVFVGRADVRGAYGGRGSAKTRTFAKMSAVWGMRYGQAGIQGQILCARQFMNSLEDSSLEEVKRAIEDEPALAAYYEVGDGTSRAATGTSGTASPALDRNIASVKSKGRILLCWVDEAEAVPEASWVTLVPTLREEDEDWNAELWVTWNPARKGSAVDKRFRGSDDPLVKVVRSIGETTPSSRPSSSANDRETWSSVPSSTSTSGKAGTPRSVEGAYFAKSLAKAKQEGQIGRVAADPLMTIRLFCDIGGTGAKADAFAIWAAQFIGKEIRVLDYYEAVGQP
jgi:phage terminase large subunit